MLQLAMMLTLMAALLQTQRSFVAWRCCNREDGMAWSRLEGPLQFHNWSPCCSTAAGDVAASSDPPLFASDYSPPGWGKGLPPPGVLMADASSEHECVLQAHLQELLICHDCWAMKALFVQRKRLLPVQHNDSKNSTLQCGADAAQHCLRQKLANSS